MKKLFLFALCIVLFGVPAFAQEEAPLEAAPGEAETPSESGDFWICPGFEAAMYSREGVSFGGSLALGYGKGAAIGLKASYFFGPDTTTLELNFLFRAYFRGALAYSGPFLQFSGGPVLCADGAMVGVPATLGSISAGLSFGWRFLFKDRWFVEPAIRAGYPYIAGAGLSAGVRF